jgi:hypothetical protein
VDFEVVHGVLAKGVGIEKVTAHDEGGLVWCRLTAPRASLLRALRHLDILAPRCDGRG